MKKNVKKALALMLVLCAGVAGCGTKKQTAQEKTASHKTTAKKLRQQHRARNRKQEN